MSIDSFSNIIRNTSMTSSFASLADLAMDKFDIYPQVIKRYSSQYRDTAITDMFLMGNHFGVSSDTHSNFQEGWYIENFLSDGIVAESAAGGTQLITLDALSVDANNRYFPKVGHVVLYKGTSNIKAVIESIDVTDPTAPVLKVRAGAGVTLPAIAANETIAILTNMWGEGTDQPTASNKTYEKLDYYFQILKEKYGITGSQLTNAPWVQLDAEGRPFDWWTTEVADSEARMDVWEEGAILLGDGLLYSPTAGSVLVSDASATVRQTKGMIPWIRERGEVLGITAATFDYTDFDLLDDYLKSQGNVSHEVLGWVGNVLGRAMSTEVNTEIVDGNGTDMSRYMMDDFDDDNREARMAMLNYRGVTLFDRTYRWRPVYTFNDPKRLGSTGYKFNEYGIFFPADMVKDAKTGINAPNVSLMYKENNGYSRRRELWTNGAAGGNSMSYIGENDSKHFYLRSHIGLSFAAPNTGILIDPEA